MIFMVAATENNRIMRSVPGEEVVDVTFASTGDTFNSKFGKCFVKSFEIISVTGTAADLKFDTTTTAGQVVCANGGTALRGWLTVGRIQ